MLDVPPEGQRVHACLPVDEVVPLERPQLRRELPVGKVVEIVPVRIPRRVPLVEEVVRDPVQRAVGETPDVDGAELRGVGHREGEVASARRPDVVAKLPARLVRHVDDLLRLELDDVELPLLVAEGQVLAVRRPLRGVAHRPPAGRELLGLAGAVLRDQVDLVLAGRVRDVRDTPAVGRPARPPVVRRRAPRQVAGRTVLDGSREDVAAGHEERPFPLRAQRGALDQVGRRHSRRPHRQAVVRHRDRDRTGRPVVDRVDLQLPVQLVDDPVGAVVAGPADVPRVAVGELRRFSRGEVVAVEVERSVPVRGEVDGVADPHRVAVGAPVGRHPLDHVRLAVEDVELLGPAPLVALPGPEVAEQRRVDHARAVGRQVSRPGLGHREWNREAPVGRRQVQPAVGEIRAVAERPEQHRLPVGRPVVDLVVVAPAGRQRPARWIPGELPRHAAGGGDDVDLLISVVLARERDARAVRREPRKELQPGMRRQPGRETAVGRRQPQVAGIAEDHPVAVDVGKAQQLRLRGRRRRRAHRDGQGDGPSRRHAGESSEHLSPPRSATYADP